MPSHLFTMTKLEAGFCGGDTGTVYLDEDEGDGILMPGLELDSAAGTPEVMLSCVPA